MSDRPAEIKQQIRSVLHLDEMYNLTDPLTTIDQKQKFNDAILKEMLSINSSTFTEAEKPAVGEIMNFLYTIYNDTIPGHDYSLLIGRSKAFHDKNGIAVMVDDTVTYGPRYVLIPIKIDTRKQYNEIVEANNNKANSNKTWSDSFTNNKTWLRVDPKISKKFGYDELYTHNSDVTPETFVKNDWEIYQRWGGKKRTRKHKTRVKKTRRVMRRRKTRD